MKKQILILSIIFCFMLTTFGCIQKYFDETNDKLLKELEVTQNRLEAMESYVSDLKERLDDKDAIIEAEKARLQETYQSLNNTLMKEIKDQKIEIEKIKNGLSLNIADTIFFNSGEVNLKPSGEKVLLKIAEILKKLPEKMIRVEGHTDNVKIGEKLKDQYSTNWDLAAKRAVNVTQFFQEKGDIEPSRLSAVSYGEYQPIKTNTTVKGRARNRRIEIILLDSEAYKIIKKKK